MEALRRMRDIGETSIPVINKDGKISGIVNINDISKEMWRERGKMRQGQYYRDKVRPSVKDVMASPHVVLQDENISACMDGMLDTEARICTVVDKIWSRWG